MVKKPHQKTAPTQEVLAIAFAAYRINGAYHKYTQRFSEEDNHTIHANKDMVKFHFNVNDFKPHDFEDFNAIDEDFDAVDIAQKHFHRYSMELLGNGLTDFQKDAFNAISQDTVPFNKLGLVAYIPELVKREVETNAFKKKLRIDYRNSKNVGSIKDKVEGVIKFLNKFYSEKWESFNYVADFNGDLVSFMNKVEYKVGERKRIKGKVKDHGKNRNFDVCETRLNYVKLFKV